EKTKTTTDELASNVMRTTTVGPAVAGPVMKKTTIAADVPVGDLPPWTRTSNVKSPARADEPDGASTTMTTGAVAPHVMRRMMETAEVAPLVAKMTIDGILLAGVPTPTTRNEAEGPVGASPQW